MLGETTQRYLINLTSALLPVLHLRVCTEPVMAGFFGSGDKAAAAQVDALRSVLCDGYSCVIHRRSRRNRKRGNIITDKRDRRTQCDMARCRE
jgi:hypothetical protein